MLRSLSCRWYASKLFSHPIRSRNFPFTLKLQEREIQIVLKGKALHVILTWAQVSVLHDRSALAGPFQTAITSTRSNFQDSRRLEFQDLLLYSPVCCMNQRYKNRIQTVSSLPRRRWRIRKDGCVQFLWGLKEELQGHGTVDRSVVFVFLLLSSFFFLLLVREGPSSSLARALKLLLHVWDINNYDGEMR